MRRALAFVVLAACGGLPSQQQIVETPAATTRSRTQQSNVEPWPASTWERDRWFLVQQFEDMDVTQRAYREAETADRAAPAPPLQGQPPPPNAPPAGPGNVVPVPKKGPAEQATLPPPPLPPRSGGAPPPPSATP